MSPGSTVDPEASCGVLAVRPVASASNGGVRSAGGASVDRRAGGVGLIKLEGKHFAGHLQVDHVPLVQLVMQFVHAPVEQGKIVILDPVQRRLGGGDLAAGQPLVANQDRAGWSQITIEEGACHLDVARTVTECGHDLIGAYSRVYS